MEIKLNDAKKAAKELNDFLGLAPAIDVKAPIDVLLEKIGLAVELLEDGELEELTEVTQQVVTAIQNQEDEEEGTEPAEEKPVAKKETKKPTKKEEVAEENPIELIKEQMEEATLEELKDLVKANKEMFPTAAKGISLQNNEEKLRAKMEADLAGDTVPPTKPTAAKEEVKKPAGKVKEKGDGVIATIVSIIEGAGKKGVLREEIHTLLVEKFPHRAKESLMSTVRVQVPGRIHKEKFELVKLKDGRYAKA